MTDGYMRDDNMTDVTMTDGNMRDCYMTDDNMTDDNMTDDNLKDGNMRDDNMTDDNMTGGTMKDGNMTDDTVSVSLQSESIAEPHPSERLQLRHRDDLNTDQLRVHMCFCFTVLHSFSS